MSGPVLLCYDGSDDAGRAIEQAGNVLPPGTAVTVTVWQPMMSVLASYGGASMAAPADTTEVDRRLEETCINTAAAGAARAHTAGFDAEPLAVRSDGPIWDALLRCADEQDAAVIVLGSRGLGGFKSALLGSVSHAVVQRAHRPVLIVPPGSSAG